MASLTIRHGSTWRARAAVVRGKQAMAKLRARGNEWRGSDTWHTAGPASTGLQLSEAGDRSTMGEPAAGTQRREERSRCSISPSRVRAVTRGWARTPKAQEHERFAQELCGAGP